MSASDSYLVTIDLLNNLAEFLEGQQDVVDGSYGEPQPNKAMSLLGAVEGEIERLKRSPGPSLPLEPTAAMIEAGRLAIMGMLEPKRTPKPKPTIAELEAILNAEDDGRSINIEADGSITELAPRTTTASEVAATAYRAMVSATEQERS